MFGWKKKPSWLFGIFRRTFDLTSGRSSCNRSRNSRKPGPVQPSTEVVHFWRMWSPPANRFLQVYLYFVDVATKAFNHREIIVLKYFNFYWGNIRNILNISKIKNLRPFCRNLCLFGHQFWEFSKKLSYFCIWLKKTNCFYLF